MKDLFGQLDGNGDGAISKSEFEDKLCAGGTNIANADKVFSQLDSNGDGSVSLTELGSALKTKGGHAHGSGGKGGGGADALMQAIDGTSSTTVTNSDGSTITTTTYADGSTSTQSTPAAAPATSSGGANSNSTAATNASSKYNLVDQMIQKQAQALATSARQSLSVSV